MIILSDHVLSSDGYAVRLMLALLGLAHEHRVVDILAPETPAADARVPRLVDGDVVETDVRGALIHLAGRGDVDGDWLPGDPGARDAVLEWVRFAGTELQAAARLRQARLFDWPCDVEADRAGAFAAYTRLDDRLVEARLLGRRFLVGDRPTIADVACFPMVALSDDVGIPLDRFHALSRYIDDITALPGFAPMPGILLLSEPRHP